MAAAPPAPRTVQRKPIPAGTFLNAKHCTTVAISFLEWLNNRGRHLETATQADVDAWYAGGSSTRHHAGRFLRLGTRTTPGPP